MLIRYFTRPSRIEELRTNPGGHLLEGFAKELCQGRYQWVAARKTFGQRNTFSIGSPIDSVDHERWRTICTAVPRSLETMPLPRTSSTTEASPAEVQCRSLVRLFTARRRCPDFNLFEPAVEAPMLRSFCDWMHRQRGASDATLSIYRFELRAFIKELGEDPREYDARNLRLFVLDKTRRSGWASIRKSICAIRMFLRFLISQGECPASLYESVPSFAHWRLSALPRYLQPDQVEKIIATADPKGPLGSRNRAILLLLARLGLRAGDIVRLRFSDVDWKEGMIRVSGKGRRKRCCHCPKRLEMRWQPI